MDFLQAIISGTLQGLTEFLPVSSSGHLVLVSSIYKIITGETLSSGGGEEILFDIMLHIGTLIAILIYFRQDIIHLTKEFFKALKEKTFGTNYEAQIPVYIVIGTIATVAVAYPLKDFFESLVSNPAVVGIFLIITGVLLYSTEIMSAKIADKVKNVNWKKSIIIGIAQGFAIAPGLSRSGSTIAAGLASGLDRVTAARYSFLLSIPVIILAAVYQIKNMAESNEIIHCNWPAILIGTLISLIIGYLCIKYFLIFISKNKLNIFAFYCWIVGFAMILYFGILH
ncbi:MAG: undecaprenyl-diphosphate phosphatase [Candidatus Gastranaerophilales bacterium]|nr:undecaprenyl-diphosphate phosphatase [Candidatus Gastranaerophilales bacterium]